MTRYMQQEYNQDSKNMTGLSSSFERRDTDEATAAQILAPNGAVGYKFALSPPGQSSLAVCGQPPPGPSHEEIAMMASMDVNTAKGGMCMVGKSRLVWIEGRSTTLLSGGASEDEFRAAAERGVILFLRRS